MKKSINKIAIVAALVSVFVVSTLMTGCAVSPPNVMAMVIKRMPEKLEYWEGELFDPAGLVLSVGYDDGTVAEVTEGYDWDLKSPLTEDDDEVKISFGGKSKYIEIEVDVKTPASIVISKLPDKTDYLVGEKFDSTGMEIVATYEDGEPVTVTEGFRVPTAKLKLGTEEIEIRYNGASVTLPITVAREIASLDVNAPPVTLTYMAGQFADLSGMNLIATYEDETTEDVTKLARTSKERLTADDTKLTVKVANKILEFDITVKPNPHVKGESVDRVEATCDTDGNAAYFTCTHCEKAFTDEFMAYEYESVVLEKHHTALVAAESEIGEQTLECTDCDTALGSPTTYYNFTNKDQCSTNPEYYMWDGAVGSQDRTNISYTLNGSGANVPLATAKSYGKDYVGQFYNGAGVHYVWENVKTAAKVQAVLKASSLHWVSTGAGSWETGDMQFNLIFDVTMNGNKLEVADDVILKGGKNEDGDYGIAANWQYIVFEIELHTGRNELVFTSKCPKTKTGKPLYADGTAGDSTQSSAILDTLAIYGEPLDPDNFDLTTDKNVLLHNFVLADQYAQNTVNVSSRFNLGYTSTATTSSANVKLATAKATNADYLQYFYGGGAVIKRFTSMVEGKAIVTFKISSGYLTKNSGGFATGDMVFNKVAKITANGTDVVFDDSVVLKGDATSNTYACMANWTEISFEMDIKFGINTIILTSLFPDDGTGKPLYKDPGENGTQSTFILDTVTIALKQD